MYVSATDTKIELIKEGGKRVFLASTNRLSTKHNAFIFRMGIK
ncbi:MAG: hypothetical protein ACI9XO_003742 [Paraglaciecola sp.]|jgi:hypothetical protein